MTSNMFKTFDSTTMNNNIMWTMITLNMWFMTEQWKIKNQKPKTSSTKVHKMNKTMIKSLTTTMLMNNFMNMNPTTINPTSNFMMNMSTSMIMWMMMNTFSTTKTKMMMMNLTPMNTPKILIPMMITIEVSSNMTRTITLTTRMTINMMMNHILMNMSNNMLMNTMNSIEIMIIMIQSYIFVTLNSMYLNEYY